MRIKNSISNLRLLLKKLQYLILVLLMGGLLVFVAIDYEFEHNLWGLIELSPSSYLVEHRLEILLALLAPQIPLLIFIFETASRTVFVRKTILKALSFGEFMVMVMSVILPIMVYQHPSVVIPLFWFLFVLDVAVFDIAYQLSNRSGRYEKLVEGHLSKLVEDAMSCIEDNTKKHVRHRIEDARKDLLEVLDDINEGMNDSYTPVRTKEYLEMLRWLSFIEDSVDHKSFKMLMVEKGEGFVDNDEVWFIDQTEGYEIVGQVMKDVDRGLKSWNRPRAMVNQKIMEIYKDQLQSAVDHDNGRYASAIANHITAPLRGFLTYENLKQGVNPFTIIRNDLLMKEFLRYLIRRRHFDKSIGRAHEVAEFIAKDCLESYFTMFAANPMATHYETEKNDEVEQKIIEGIYAERCLKTLSDITILSLRYDHHELFCDLISIYNDLDGNDPINSSEGKKFREYVRCNLLTIYYYIRHHHELFDAYPRNAIIDKEKYEPLLKILGSWGAEGLTEIFEKLESDQRHLYRWGVADLEMTPSHKRPHDIQGGSIKLLWVDLLSDPATSLGKSIRTSHKEGVGKLHGYLSRLNVEAEVNMGDPTGTHLDKSVTINFYLKKKATVERMLSDSTPE